MNYLIRYLKYITRKPQSLVIIALMLLFIPFAVFPGAIPLLDKVLRTEIGGLVRPVRASISEDQQVTDIFLPIIMKNFPVLETVFGVQMSTITVGGGLDKVTEANNYWVGGAVVEWSAVEPNQGDRNWGALASVEQQYKNAASRGMTVIANVRSTPEWAQEYDGYFCGPMKREHFDEFASFMVDLVKRYSQSPYNIKYWEIWNEPDIDPYDNKNIKFRSNLGCWGDISKSHYNGGYYADMLKVVYPEIKKADPNAQVLIGGLLLDCDPNNPPGGKNCDPATFFEGILINGGGPYFDSVSFHAYEWYFGALGKYGSANWDSSWNTTGPVVKEKVEFLKLLLDQYDVNDKYLINTETGLICDSCENNNEFETTKANYVAQVYAMAIDLDLRGNLWYSLLGWRNTSLLGENLEALPAFNAFKFARLELRDAERLGRLSGTDISNATNLIGYKFTRGDRQIWVLWSLDGNNHTVNLVPGTPLAIYDSLGNPQALSSSLEVGLTPLYIEWPQ